MRNSTSTFLLAALLLTACGDDQDDDDGGGTDSTDTTTTGTDTDGPPPITTTTDATTTDATTTDGGTATTGTTDGETTDGETTDGETTDGETTDGETTGGGAALEASITDLVIAQDCMPIVLPDPVEVTFTVMLNNTGDGPATATVASAVFVDGGGSDVATVEVTPMQLGPVAAGDQQSFPLSKVADSLTPPDGCDVLACNETYTFELELDVDGTTMVVSDTAMVDCVF